MAPQSEREELRTAWRALSGRESKEGWLTIAVATGCACRVLAGRRFPANEEAVLFGFRAASHPIGDLPQGRGFEVCTADLEGEGDERLWVALCRQSAGSLDLFETMAEDVISMLGRLRGVNEPAILRGFLERVRAWQEFMRRGADGTLSQEAELGLVGELEMLRELIAAGVSEHEVVDAWKGPLEAVHDFSLKGGAIEVKSTISPAGFPARMASLEQLDDSRVRWLFLAGLRFRLDPRGLTLPELARSISGQLASSPPVEQAFQNLVLRAGLSWAVAGRYTRRFWRCEMRVLEVADGFPRLTRAQVAREILSARYEIDLDLVHAADFGLSGALQKIGVA
jgi:hypothetical protein